MNIVAVTQARVSSTRLPNKVLIKIKGQLFSIFTSTESEVKELTQL